MKVRIFLAILATLILAGSASAGTFGQRGAYGGNELPALVDILVFRPIGFVATVTGAVAGAPFYGAEILFTGDTRAFDALVAAPAIFTFVRPVGRTN